MTDAYPYGCKGVFLVVVVIVLAPEIPFQYRQWYHDRDCPQNNGRQVHGQDIIERVEGFDSLLGRFVVKVFGWKSFFDLGFAFEISARAC